MRHHEIEEDQIRLVEGEEFEDLAWIGGLPKVRVSALLQNSFEQENVCRLVVHNENPAFLNDFLLYHALTLRVPSKDHGSTCAAVQSGNDKPQHWLDLPAPLKHVQIRSFPELHP
jgi:hypothetical protein